jgi:hypothetical protein
MIVLGLADEALDLLDTVTLRTTPLPFYRRDVPNAFVFRLAGKFLW